MKSEICFPSLLFERPCFFLDSSLRDKKLTFQNQIHSLTKHRTQLLKSGINLPMRKYNVSLEHFEALIENYRQNKLLRI